MNNQILERVVGEYGIYRFTILDKYNVVNLRTKK